MAATGETKNLVMLMVDRARERKVFDLPNLVDSLLGLDHFLNSRDPLDVREHVAPEELAERLKGETGPLVLFIDSPQQAIDFAKAAREVGWSPTAYDLT